MTVSTASFYHRQFHNMLTIYSRTYTISSVRLAVLVDCVEQ